jgi:cytochrome P450
MLQGSRESGFFLPALLPTPGKQAYYDPERQAWQVFRYTEVQRVLFDHTTFTSQRKGLLDPRETKPGTISMTDMDPPEHRRMRTLLAQAFTPRATERLQTQIITQVQHLLDHAVEQGEMDFIEDFAVPLPLLVIMELLGIAQEDVSQMRSWSDTFIAVLHPDSAKAKYAMAAYFGDIVEQKRHEPQDDLISALLKAHMNGRFLTTEEIVHFCFLLLVAGNETTRNLIGNAMLCFQYYSDALAEIRADPALLPGALEEVLRYLPPVTQFPRIASVDTTIDDQDVKAGQWVCPWILSANRDEEQFSEPQAFDIRRTPNRHLSFGTGIHHCMGAPLARLEGQIAFKLFLERFPTITYLPVEADKAEQVKPLSGGVQHLPIAFT